MFKDKLIEYLTPLNFSLSDFQIELLSKYCFAVFEKNKLMNLISFNSESELVYRHICDSLAITKALVNEHASVLDLGSGAGLPGIPLGIVYSKLNLLLLDSTRKKVDFLQETIKALSLSNISASHNRAEVLAQGTNFRTQFDYVVSRAMASLPILIELSMPFLKINGTLIAMKGMRAKEEINLSKNALDKCGGYLEDLIVYDLPNLEQRFYLVVVKKISHTPTQYPRIYSKILKSPL